MFFSILLLAHLQAAIIPILLGIRSIKKFKHIRKNELIPFGFIFLGLASISEMIDHTQTSWIYVDHSSLFNWLFYSFLSLGLTFLSISVTKNKYIQTTNFCIALCSIISYFLIDQAFAISNEYLKKNKNRNRYFHLVGGGATCWVIWQSTTFFGIIFLIMWELIVLGLNINPVLLPAPTAIGSKFIEEIPTLWIDFTQTLIKGALSGYILGCGSAFIIAILIDKFDFLKRGLLPLGNFVSALPIVGMAPIFVMWFGFDWESKCAVVVVMVFFPMLVNTVQGLSIIDKSRQDLMKTYSASYLQTLFKLRLPSALPFVFNGLKICSTLALIGAIVAEFFGSPIKGMGFRISSEVGRFALDMVWAEIFVAALAGCLFYGFIALMEKQFTFWHPSQQK